MTAQRAAGVQSVSGPLARSINKAEAKKPRGFRGDACSPRIAHPASAALKTMSFHKFDFSDMLCAIHTELTNLRRQKGAGACGCYRVYLLQVITRPSERSSRVTANNAGGM